MSTPQEHNGQDQPNQADQPDQPDQDTNQMVAHVAQVLGESEKRPVTTISRITQQFGATFVQQMLEETLQIEAQGGLLLSDGSRRRTPGGVFFYLVRKRISKKDTFYLFYKEIEQKRRKKDVPFDWKDRIKVAHELKKEQGEARVKVTLIGRPGKVVEKRTFTMTMMTERKVPALPRGMPEPPQSTTTYMVYISKKQWDRVKEAIKNPNDVLIIEGFARYDPELEGIAVFASNTLTRFLQQKQRQSQSESESESDEKAAAEQEATHSANET
ncbi:MAG: hypothetical protein HC884_00495 [Chloroflexaceae bacterium]|nr:hypothetical protein [Chloroflexaceae bacterium]